MRSSDIRRTFTEFFLSQGHTQVASSPLVPPDDPTLMFTTAGMVQFKPLYSGAGELPYRRACSVQKCMRAGGKGSDLENVGRTLRHHTFFEMLGNFSFGDYFKREALQWAWEFSTKVAGLDPNRIYASVYKDDHEAWDIWTKEIGVPESRMVRLGDKDNFWGPAGDTGACGPCSELYYDRGERHGADVTFNQSTVDDNDPNSRFIEFWNCVFSQFDQQKDGSRPPLKNRGVDTGMSVERLACLTQETDSLYETDTMGPITQGICDLLGLPAYKSNAVETRQAINVVADHVRALTFVMNEGVLPGNEGRGYVMRRILRRAARYGRRLGVDRPFLNEVVPLVLQTMSGDYPEILKTADLVRQVIRLEEEGFARTLGDGLKRLDNVLAPLTSGAAVPGEDIFILNTTYGLPLDDIREVASDRGFALDESGYDERLQRHRDESRKQAKGARFEAVHEELRTLQATHGATVFLGAAPAWNPDEESVEAYAARIAGIYPLAQLDDVDILAVFRTDAEGCLTEPAMQLTAGSSGAVILNRTPFYAEAGGQVGDTGTITTSGGLSFTITATVKTPEDLIVHIGTVDRGNLGVGTRATASVDMFRRYSTMRHHTATHLMQGALKRVVGQHVTQQGSYVGPDRLRFDFTNPEGLKPEALVQISRLVNDQIMRSQPVTTRVLPLDEARKLPGVIAPFGERYGGSVRVVDVADWDIEFCGGTHVVHTGQIGGFAIISETAIAAGVRRLEAVVGPEAWTVLQGERMLLKRLADELRVPKEQIADRVVQIADELKAARKELAAYQARAAAADALRAAESAPTVSGVRVVVAVLANAAGDALRDAATDVRGSLKEPSVVLLGSVGAEGKVAFVCAVHADVVAKGVSAGKLVGQVAAVAGGKGGGKPDLAQAGGTQPDKLGEALEAGRKLITEALAS